PAEVCAGEDLVLDGNPAGGSGTYTTHLWTGDTGPLSATNVQNPTFNSGASGIYNLIYTVTDDNGCIKTDNITITVNNNPTASTSPDPAEICAGINLILNGNPAGGSGTYTTHSWTGDTGPLSTTNVQNPTFNTAVPGTYNLTYTVTDNNGCTGTDNITVTVFDNPTTSIAPGPIKVCAGIDLALDGNPAGGSGTYTTHSWTGDFGPLSATNVQNPTFNTVVTGVYNLTYTVTDDNGCIGSDNITVTVNDNPTASIAGTNASCNDACDGSATVNTSGGIAPYTYLWDDPSAQSTATATGLCVNTFIVTVTDSMNCTDIDTVTITEPAELTTSIAVTDVTCNGGNNGAADLSVSGGTIAYTYSWSPGGEVSQDLINQTAGTDTIIVTDANGCKDTAYATINEPSAIILDTSTVDANCGQSDGEVSVSASGGTGSYTYLWDDINSSTTATVTGLPAGSYNVAVTDSSNCAEVATAIINDLGGGTATAVVDGNNTCYDSCDGSASATIVGGTAPFTYLWDDPGSQTTATATGFCAGNYTVTVTDGAGCISADGVTITEPALLDASIDYSTNALCCFSCDGEATVSVSGGTTPYTYIWTNYIGDTISISDSASGLCSDTMYVTVVDTNGCIDGDTIFISEPSLLTASIIGTDVSCNGGSDGAADLTVFGGTPPYTYSWSSGPTIEDLTNLIAGIYSVMVTDFNGCDTTAIVIINQPAPLALTPSSVNANCGQSDGEVSVSVSGGTTSYTYLWDDPNSSVTPTVTGLPANIYYITVTDANNCTAITTATILDIPGGTASATVNNNASGAGICDGQATVSMTGGTPPFTYLWDDPLAQTTTTAVSLCAGSYCISVTDVNGCTDTACVVITEPNAIILTIVGTDVLCNGDCTGEADLTVTGGVPPYTYLWTGGLTAEDIVNLCAGTYDVTVTDSNSVTATASIIITEPATPLSTNITGTNILCNGDFTGAVDLSVAGGTVPYTYLWAPGSETTEDLTNLAAGTYDVTVTDTNGCTTTDSYIITEPTAITLNTGTNNANCGQPDGDATVFASGGTGAYTYLWNDSSSQTTAIATGLPAGAYTVIVTDSAGCTETGSVNISDIGGGTASTTVDNNASCIGDCDGQATASITGGTVPYTYLWDNPSSQTIATATGLCATTYNVTITDDVGCVSTASVTISEPVILTVTTAGNDAICNGGCEGNATATPSGGIGAYTYLWDDPATQITATATGLCTGTYNVTVFDQNGCIATDNVLIGEPVAITLTLTYNPSNCGQADGEATATPSNGTIPYSYLWNDPLSQTSATATGLLAGGCTVTVTDSNGCTATGTVTVSDTTGPSANISSSNDVSCPGGNDGEITVNVYDGIPPYTYLWDDLLSQTTTTADSLLAGTYTVIITDANGCITTAGTTINEPPVLIASISSSADASCNGDCDGNAFASATGGTSPYTYLWNDPGSQTTAIATGLCNGPYNVIVTDINGCTDNISVTINEPTQLSLTTSATDASCTGVCDGNATITASGGTSPYTYQWDDPGTQTTTIATGLCKGTFIVTVTDANGCIDSSTVFINEPAVLTSSLISEVGVDCNGDCDGYAEVSGTGGILPYTYLWSNGQTAALAINLCAGIYVNDLTDANGCSATITAIISEPAALTNVFSSIDADCNGNATGEATANISGGTTPYTYQWNDGNLQTTGTATGLIAGTYSVLVTDSNGCNITNNITINEPVPITLVVTTTGSNCGQADGGACVTVASGVSPFTYQWNDASSQTTACATGLFSGSYNILVTDATGCTATKPVMVNDLGSPTFSIASSDDANCNGGCDGFATALITNGTPPYTYQWNDPSSQSTAIATGLCAGGYVVSAVDANACAGNVSATIGEPSVLNVTISSQTDASCNGDCDGDATVLAAGGTPPYTYQWNNPGMQTISTATGLCTGTYGVTVSDAHGCTDTTSVTISEPDIITLTTSSINANCGQSDGSASVVATGGNGLYGYLWNDANTQNTATAINLLAGPYNVTVTDILGCTTTASVIVNDIPAGTPTISSTIDVSCNGGSDGAATVSMSGGTIPFTYLWDDINSQATTTATGLPANTYTVSIIDSNGCLVTSSADIYEPILLTVITLNDSVNCYGVCDGSALASPSGGTMPYSYLWNDPLSQSTVTATGLCVGTYIITITDGNGCIVTETAIVGSPALLVLTESHTDANCGQADGSATVTVNGGKTPYIYTWDPPGSQGFPTYDSLSAGTYTVTVNDANGCSEDISITISDLSGPTAVIVNSDSVSCYGGNNGFATVSIAGGTTPYSYEWDDPLSQTAPTAANLPAGNYIVSVTDSNGCIASASVIIYETDSIIFNPTSTGPACYGDSNGTAGVIVVGGTTPYTYQWDDPASQTAFTATGLSNGIYTVIITDANGCTRIGTFVISDPLPMTASATATDVSCFGYCDGTATAIPSNGTSPYTYQWDDPNSQASVTAGNLCEGTYNVAIIDDNGCIASASATVGTPTLLNAFISSSGNNICSGNCNGWAQSTVIGGTPPYTYLWNDPLAQTTAQATGLCAGLYGLTVSDASGCSSTISVTITEPQMLVITTTYNNVTCNGACDGNATVSVSGGTPPYTYQWNDASFQTTLTADSLCAGSYTVIVTDVNGCFKIATVNITELPVLGLVNSSNISSTCGNNNGGACVSVIGGATPFVITWDDPFTTVGACIFNVYAGVYNPVVSDSNGCIFTMPVIVNDIAGPVIDSILTAGVTCAGDLNGTAEVFATGDSSALPLSYLWQIFSDTLGDSTFVDSLSGATYTVTVIDNNGCVTSGMAVVFEPNSMASAIISSDDPSCSGVCDGSATVMVAGGVSPYAYQWTDGQTTTTATGLCWGIHNVIIMDVNGCFTTSTVVLIDPAPIVVSDSVIDVSCQGYDDGAIYLDVSGGTPFYSYNWIPNVSASSIATNLLSGTFIIMVTDMNGCIFTHAAIVNEPVELTATTNFIPSTCGNNNGTAIATPSDGMPPYTYLWNDFSATTTDTATNLIAGNYNVDVTDANGCSITLIVLVNDIGGPAIVVTPTGANCYGDSTGTASVTTSGGITPYTYQWNDVNSQTTATATGLAAGIVSITVIDANGCSVTGYTTITQPNLLEVIPFGTTTICYGGSTPISATGNGGTVPYTYIWDNGLDSIQTHTVQPNSTTTYTVYVIDGNNCQSPDTTITITVYPPISVTVSGDVICDGENATISASASGGNGGPYTYLWDDPFVQTNSSITVLPFETTTYTVIVSDNCPSPVVTDSAIVTVNPFPEIGFLATEGGCAPYPINFTDTSIISNGTITIWSWNFGDPASGSENSSTDQNPWHTYASAGTYDVTLSVISDQGCPSPALTLPGVVTVFSQPTAQFYMGQNGFILSSPASTSILSPTVDFIDTSSNNVVIWEWDFGDTESGFDNNDTSQNPLHTYSEAGTYLITLEVYTDSGCSDYYTDYITLTGEYTLFVPNAFTPNQDRGERNEYFKPVGVGIDEGEFIIHIFNKWGDMIYKYNGNYEGWPGWDGRANNGKDIAQTDVYVWKIRTTDVNGEKRNYIGHVTLIR
ncbi:MAG: PKD domain-containing protein, partial [Bacteroidota bacterium]